MCFRRCFRRLRRSAAAEVIITVELRASTRRARVFRPREVAVKLRAKFGLAARVARVGGDVGHLPRLELIVPPAPPAAPALGLPFPPVPPAAPAEPMATEALDPAPPGLPAPVIPPAPAPPCGESELSST